MYLRIMRASPLPTDVECVRIVAAVDQACRVVIGDTFTCEVSVERTDDGEALEVAEVSREEWERFLKPTRLFREQEA